MKLFELLQHSLSTEKLNAEMKDLEGLMKDLNSMSPMASVNKAVAGAAASPQPQQQPQPDNNSYNC